jgi:large subunit ribosomal protein L7/L12
MAGLTQQQKDQFIDIFKSMTIMDAAEMKKRIETELGIQAAAPMAMAAMPAAAAEAEKPEEPTEFNVILVEAGDKKIQVIKAVREITSLGLKEAKALVDEAPKPVKESVSKEEAQEIADKLQAAGAKVEVKPA